MLTLKQVIGMDHAIAAQCRHCRHIGEFDPAALLDRYGDIYFKQLEPAMKCSNCRAKGADLWIFYSDRRRRGTPA